MKKKLLFLAFLLSLGVQAQRIDWLEQQKLSTWNIFPGNYSGITPIGNDRYAVVSDKDMADGFHVWHIELNSGTGYVTNVTDEGFYANPFPVTDHEGLSVRDCEGIAYYPPRQTLFISGEGDQEVLEYALNGKPTGRKLEIPAMFSRTKIVANGGFEALAYDTVARCFWTMTETTLPIDGTHTSPGAPSVLNVMRLLQFDENLKCVAQYAYRMNVGSTPKNGTHYAYGVPAITPLGDGRLLVMEREVNVSSTNINSQCVVKLFAVQPTQANLVTEQDNLRQLSPTQFIQKTQVAAFTTYLTPFKFPLANYEGMCFGPRLQGGRRALLLINDSQGGAGNRIARLKDYIKVGIVYDAQ